MAAMSTGRKVFHCAVDETALTTNISEIKKWTTHGAIDLIVPLYTLERLHALKRAGSQVAINARETVRFLDKVTSGKDKEIPSERVVLQGPFEQYESWDEAEKFFLPEFEEELEEELEAANRVDSSKPAPEHEEADKTDAADDLSQMLLSRLNFKKNTEAASVPPSRTSPECAQHDGEQTSKPGATLNGGHRRSKSGSTIPVVPASLRPLLSALLWRLHDGPDAKNAAKNCILITNDRTTQTWAQKFGIGVKNIAQLRTAIQYEEREYKNRCKYVEKTQNQAIEPKPKTLLSYDEETDEDELVFVPRGGRGKGSSRGARGGGRKAAVKPNPTSPVPVEKKIEIPTQPIDPDSFSRDLSGVSKVATPPSAEQGTPQAAARGTAGASRRGAPNSRRGGGGSRGSTRGNGRGRGKLWVP
ncbi:hypothetical protein N7470_006851 [Penicillium chermesinum]|nr:hypothetical protein N7470_006851 [Penicillium chermesinum]